MISFLSINADASCEHSLSLLVITVLIIFSLKDLLMFQNHHETIHEVVRLFFRTFKMSSFNKVTTSVSMVIANITVILDIQCVVDRISLMDHFVPGYRMCLDTE